MSEDEIRTVLTADEPCSECKGAMNKKVENNPGARVIYDWPEGSWEAGPEALKARERERRQRRRT